MLHGMEIAATSDDGPHSQSAFMAKLKPSIRPTETYTESNFLRLHTYAGPRQCPGRLVTIEHLCYRGQTAGAAERPSAGQRRGGAPRPGKAPRQRDAQRPAETGWRCETIVDGEEMSKEDALFIAKTYAAQNNVPVIYECHSD